MCLSGCCICFTHMLQIFYLDLAYVLQWCSNVWCVFLQVFQMRVSNISSVFIRMLQVLYLNISKVDWVLHLSPRLLMPHLSVSSASRCRLGICCLLPLLSMLVTLGRHRPHVGAWKAREKMITCAGVWMPHPSRRYQACKKTGIVYLFLTLLDLPSTSLNSTIIYRMIWTLILWSIKRQMCLLTRFPV